MLERYADILPELILDKDRFEAYMKDMRLSKYEIRQQLFLINYILDKIKDAYNMPFVFGKNEDQVSKIMESWRICLSVLYPSWVINGLYRLLSGEVSRYVDFPPRHAIAFNGICRECPPVSSKLHLEYKIFPEDELPFEVNDRINKGNHFLEKMKRCIKADYSKDIDDIPENKLS